MFIKFKNLEFNNPIIIHVAALYLCNNNDNNDNITNIPLSQALLIAYQSNKNYVIRTYQSSSLYVLIASCLNILKMSRYENV